MHALYHSDSDASSQDADDEDDNAPFIHGAPVFHAIAPRDDALLVGHRSIIASLNGIGVVVSIFFLLVALSRRLPVTIMNCSECAAVPANQWELDISLPHIAFLLVSCVHFLMVTMSGTSGPLWVIHRFVPCRWNFTVPVGISYLAIIGCLWGGVQTPGDMLLCFSMAIVFGLLMRATKAQLLGSPILQDGVVVYRPRSLPQDSRAFCLWFLAVVAAGALVFLVVFRRHSLEFIPHPTLRGVAACVATTVVAVVVTPLTEAIVSQVTMEIAQTFFHIVILIVVSALLIGVEP